MKAASFQQPGASAILLAGKTVENRTTATGTENFGTLAVHARIPHSPRAAALEAKRILNTYAIDLGTMPTGAILGVVDLIDIHHSDTCATGDGYCSPWASPRSWHWVLANPRVLGEPVPTAGAAGVWTLAPSVLAAVTARLEASS
ncbi:hypothetical protein AB0I28_32755 [Phytomonospora sp. NPDC050363]|uniref:hypothetical protein n=1 Tax=Phytomonospora sp. NPDC050363 TaxID=3155642 RepID=UPI0033CCDF6D